MCLLLMLLLLLLLSVVELVLHAEMLSVVLVGRTNTFDTGCAIT